MRVENSSHGYQTTSGQRLFIHCEGTSYLFSKRVNRCQGDGFLSVGAQRGAIKLAMAGQYLGLVAPSSSIVWLLIPYLS